MECQVLNKVCPISKVRHKPSISVLSVGIQRRNSVNIAPKILARVTSFPWLSKALHTFRVLRDDIGSLGVGAELPGCTQALCYPIFRAHDLVQELSRVVPRAKLPCTLPFYSAWLITFQSLDVK